MNGDHRSFSKENITLDEPSNSPVPPVNTPSPPPRKEGRRLQWIKVLQISAIFFVLVLLTLPLIVYYLPQQSVSDETCHHSTSSFCTDIPNNINQMHEVQCSSVFCTPQEYNGSTCLLELQRWKNYHSWTLNDTPLFIPSDIDQVVQERAAQQVLTKLQLLGARETCVKAFKPFMCLLLFGLCNSSGQALKPSHEECVFIQSDSCSEEVQLAMDDPNMVELFPTCNRATNSCTNDSKQVYADGSGSQNITCSEEFYFDESTQMCVPECGVWTSYGTTTGSAFNIIVITADVIGLFIDTAIILASVVQYKKMLKFPSTITLYQCVALFVHSFMDILSRVDKQQYVCGSRNLLENVEDGYPTPLLCRLAGGIFIYVLLQAALWCLFHSAIIFWGVVYPVHYRVTSNSGRMKYVHLTMVVVGIALPLILILIYSRKGGFGLSLLLHYSCVPNNMEAGYYCFLVPLVIIAMASLTMLVITFTKISLKAKKTNTSHKTEIKLLALIIFSCLFVLYFVTISSLVSRIQLEFGHDAFTNFSCESSGTQDGRSCSKPGYGSYLIASAIAYVWISIIGANNVIYVLDIGYIKKKVCSK